MKFDEVDYNKLSPMMRQYYDIKKNYKDILLFYRLGDFYELFFDDAMIASRVLNLTLTGKNAGLETRIPMCGVPHASVKTYIKKAVDAGYKLAICEQTENPKEAKGIVKREVIDIISKGTLTDFEYLDNKDYNYVANIIEYPNSYICIYADISAGVINSTKFVKDEEKLFNLVLNENFKEVILETSADALLINKLKNTYNVDITLEDGRLDEDLEIYKSIDDLKILDAVKHILYYLKVVRLKNIDGFNEINIINNDEYLYMDVHTIRNLELFETLRLKERVNSLIWLIDKCSTSMGSRKLKSWILKPLTSKNKINERLDKVEKLNENFLIRASLIRDLNEVYDIERLTGKLVSGSINPRDLLNLASSLKVLPSIKQYLNDLGFKYDFDTLLDEVKLITDAIDENAPITLKEGGIINSGFNEELDELRNIKKGGKDFIAASLADAKEKTGIQNLKIGYNKVFGYFIEVTKANIDKIDDSLGWSRKQTLVNAERYITPELKEKENQILNAEENIINLEYELFTGIREKIKEKLTELNTIASVISEVDALVSLSVSSENLKLTRPIFSEDETLKIIGGRHPVVEHVNSDFVSNDIVMDRDTKTLLITGPNMSGKSTFERQLAIIVILAQAGSFVPAELCLMPVFDKIFTRIGASDDLVSGDSTFMVEMKEANNAIVNATKNSLIIFDELGRGTSTFDGMSLAEAILKYINNNIKCKTLFSTHYHELTNLENEIEGIKNIHVDAIEDGDEVIFTHKMIDGPASKSYGINVAKLSGINDEIISNAKILLDGYEKKELNEKKEDAIQIGFNFNEDEESKIIKEIKNVNLDELTPKEAQDFLYLLKKML